MEPWGDLNLLKRPHMEILCSISAPTFGKKDYIEIKLNVYGVKSNARVIEG